MRDALPTTTLCSSTCDGLFLLRNNKKKKQVIIKKTTTLDLGNKCQVIKTMYIMSCVTQYISVTPIIRRSISQIRTKFPQERLNHCLQKVRLTVARITVKCECWIKAAGLAIHVNSKINKDCKAIYVKKKNHEGSSAKSCCFRFLFYLMLLIPPKRGWRKKGLYLCASHEWEHNTLLSYLVPKALN